MKKEKYKNAFADIHVDDKVVESLVYKAYNRKNIFRISFVSIVTIILALSLSVTAVASKISTGSFIGFFIDTKGNETLISNNIVDVGQTRISGNYSITLEKVIADDTTIYSLFNIKTIDGSPVYPKTYPVPYLVNNSPTYPVNDLAPTDEILINGGWFININGKLIGTTCRSNWIRVDDLSDPSNVEIAMYTQLTSFSDKLKGLKVEFNVSSIGGIAYNLTEKVNDSVTIAQGNWKFEFTLNTVLQSNKYTCQINNRNYNVKITPISMIVYSDSTIPFVEGKQRFENIFSVDSSDGTSTKAIWSQTALAKPSGKATEVIFNFEKIINPINITAIKINNNLYPIITGK